MIFDNGNIYLQFTDTTLATQADKHADTVLRLSIGSPAWLYCRHESLEDYPSKRLNHLLWPPCKYKS